VWQITWTGDAQGGLFLQADVNTPCTLVARDLMKNLEKTKEL